MFKMQDIAALAFANMRHEDHNEEWEGERRGIKYYEKEGTDLVTKNFGQ